MMYRRYGLMIVGILFHACTQAMDVDTRATLRFATACANCHEGECSGRTSFTLKPQAAFTHIRQYAGPVDDDLAHGLHIVLERMKAECRYEMPPAIDLADGALEGRALTERFDAWSGRYFIPLPDLEAGNYRLSGDLPGGKRVSIELVDWEFDAWLDHCADIREGGFDLAFALPRIEGGFLRLRPDGPHTLSRLSFVAVD